MLPELPIAPSVLLVDDDPGAIQVLSKCLSGLGRLRFATSGAAALRLTREEAPDLMLLDAEMPGMSGFKVWEAMRPQRTLVIDDEGLHRSGCRHRRSVAEFTLSGMKQVSAHLVGCQGSTTGVEGAAVVQSDCPRQSSSNVCCLKG